MREFIDMIPPPTEPLLMEVEVVPPIRVDANALALIEDQGTIIGEKDGFEIGKATVEKSGEAVDYYYAKQGNIIAYAGTRVESKWTWLLEMASVMKGVGGMRAIIRYLLVERNRIAVDRQLSMDAIGFLEANIAAGQFAAMIADYHANTMTTYNPSKHNTLALYDQPFGNRPANPNPSQYGWVLVSGFPRGSILSEHVLGYVPIKKKV